MQSTNLPSARKAVSLQDLRDREFDYVIVGGGTSGCLLAARLAAESPLLANGGRSSILLVEAGRDDHEDPENLIPGLTKPKFGEPSGNWGYTTVPQKELGGREVPYPRGRGMGGSSANNFMAWVRGSRSDWDEWARRVGDDWWRWDRVVEVMKKLEDFRPECPAGEERYATSTPEAHGKGGPLAVGYNKVWQPIIKHCLIGAEQVGHVVNPDNNDGNAEGLAIAQFNTDNGVRRTSATAFLHPEARSRLDNLTIITDTLCSKVLFEGKRAVGVELLSATDQSSPLTRVRTAREVILCAGAFASPQILLLSGVGPKEDLAQQGVPCVHNLPAVGQNIQDHTALACEFIIDKSIAGHNQLLNDATALEAAREEYEKSQTGPLAMFGASAIVLFPRLAGLFATQEFANLPAETRRFLKTEGLPSTEIWMHGGPLFYLGPCPPDASVLCVEGLCQNNQSRGKLTLASTNPRDLPRIDPAYLAHPYDLRIAVETLREIIKVAESPAISSIRVSTLHGPRSPMDESVLASADGRDDAILEKFVKETLTQGFHSMSTCVMGRAGEENRVVGSDFKVVDVEGLRVADMSVCPILTTNHTQINAYLIGERCADLVLKDMKDLEKTLISAKAHL